MTDAVEQAIKTPPARFSLSGALLSGQSVPYLAARLGARIGRWYGRPLKLGRTVIAIRHADVAEMLHRDLDFLIAPVNRTKIQEVNGEFVLGLDRSAVLVAERHALYAALAAFDLDAFAGRVRARIAERSGRIGDRFDAIADFTRPLAAESAADLFGVGAQDLSLLADVARAIFAHIFLNLGNDEAVRKRALSAAPIMREWLETEIKRRRARGELGDDYMGQLLRQSRPADDHRTRRTLGGMLVGSIDTTTTAVTKVLCMALKDGDLERSILQSRGIDETYGWCLEAMRRWPHNPILLRRAGSNTTLAGTDIGPGELVIAWTHAAMLDSAAFPDPLRLSATRDRAAYLHFGDGLHPCAGRVVNAIQIPLLVDALLRLGLRRNGRLKWAGPFPDRLPVRKKG